MNDNLYYSFQNTTLGTYCTMSSPWKFPLHVDKAARIAPDAVTDSLKVPVAIRKPILKAYAKMAFHA